MKLIITSLLISSCFLWFSNTALSQKSELDSLKKELQNHKKKDTTRANILNSLAIIYCSSDMSKAKLKADEANSLSKKLNYKKGEAASCIAYGKIQMSKSELDDALSNGFHALKLNQEINNSKGIISCYNLLGTVYFYKEDLEQALKYLNKGLTLAEKIDNKKKQSDISNNLGAICYSKGDFNNAIVYFKKSIAIDESLGDKEGAVHSLGNVAVIYKLQGRTIEALDYFNKCLLFYRKSNDKLALSGATLNIGALYDQRKQYKKALKYYKESLQLNNELENKREITKCLVAIGSVYSSTKKYDEALDCYSKAYKISKEIKSKEQIATCYEHMGGINLVLKKPKTALNYFISNLEICEELDYKPLISHAHLRLSETYRVLKQNESALFHGLACKHLADSLSLLDKRKQVNIVLARVYEAKGEFKAALGHFKVYKDLSDTLFGKESVEKITQLEYEYKYKRKLESANYREKKLNQTVKSTYKDLEKYEQKYLWVIIASLLVAMLLGGIIFYMKLRNVKSKSQNIIIEQKLLRSQMTPHFIFNSLSVLQGMIINKEEQKSINYLSKFSKLLRIILENSRDKIVSLAQEIAAIENYLTLQNLENESYNYTVEVDESIDVSTYMVPPMLIQPFVENAVEHAFVNQIENKSIDVHLSYSNENLTCTITDNGIGIDSQKMNTDQKKKSLSTTITNERLKMLSKDFKTNGALTIEDRQKHNETGTIVTIIIPHKIQIEK